MWCQVSKILFNFMAKSINFQNLKVILRLRNTINQKYCFSRSIGFHLHNIYYLIFTKIQIFIQIWQKCPSVSVIVIVKGKHLKNTLKIYLELQTSWFSRYFYIKNATWLMAILIQILLFHSNLYFLQRKVLIFKHYLLRRFST